MINAKGIIQNNGCITTFLRELKSNKKQYPVLNKEAERKLINKYVKIAKDENGNDILDTTDNLYQKYISCKDENYKKHLYLQVRRVLVWIGDETELANLLVMHNLKYVSNIAKKYCKITVDYDNMVSKGMYGLVYAAQKFNPFNPITVPDKTDPNYKIDKKIARRLVKFDENGNFEYTKFCTYASSWIRKYVLDEFGKKSKKFIDDKSISINGAVKIKNSTDNNQTMENYIDEMVSPDYSKPKTIDEELEENDVLDFYSKIQEYVSNSSELTAIERQIVLDTYYNHKTIKDIAEECNMNTQCIMLRKKKALTKIKNFLSEKLHVNTKSDLTVRF